jgi:hypothetical protein
MSIGESADNRHTQVLQIRNTTVVKHYMFVRLIESLFKCEHTRERIHPLMSSSRDDSMDGFLHDPVAVAKVSLDANEEKKSLEDGGRDNVYDKSMEEQPDNAVSYVKQETSSEKLKKLESRYYQ